MPDVPQIWDVPLTPAQRWALVQLAFHSDAPKVTDAAGGKKLRRALRALGLMAIRDALRAHDKISTALAQSSTRWLHKITAENLECVLGWASVPRHTSIEIDVGEVFDLFEAIKADPTYLSGQPGAAPIPAFDPDAEDWKPPADPEPFTITCPSCRQQFDLSELGTARQP
jgi:hypothetical protein